MNNTQRYESHPSIDDILNAYITENPEPNKDTLKTWVEQYPQFEKELTDLTVSWTLTRWLPESPDVESLDENKIVLYGMSALQNILHQTGEQSDSKEVPLQGIIAEGTALGFTIGALAEQTDLSVAIISKLDRRLLHYSSLPVVVVEKLAKVLHQSFAVIATYLQLNPRPAHGARYRANQSPTLQNLEDFFEAVRNDQLMSEVQRQRWLDLKPPE